MEPVRVRARPAARRSDPARTAVLSVGLALLGVWGGLRPASWVRADATVPAGPAEIIARQRIQTYPPGAQVSYPGGSAVTPAELPLRRSRTPLWVQLVKPGYEVTRLLIVPDAPRSHFVELHPQDAGAPHAQAGAAPPRAEPHSRRAAQGPRPRATAAPRAHAQAGAALPRELANDPEAQLTTAEMNHLLDGFLEVRFRGCCRAAGASCNHLIAEVQVLPSGKLGSLQAYVDPPGGPAETCIRQVVRSAQRREFTPFVGHARTFERSYTFDSPLRSLGRTRADSQKTSVTLQ